MIRNATLVTLAGLVLACSPGAGSSAAPSSAPPSSPPATRIEVKLTDALRIEPAEITAPAGVPVTFVVTNAGAISHEFFIGSEADQAMHDQEMMDMGGMGHDEEMGIGVEPGKTEELTVTFPDAGTTLAGCHVAGHYAGGMKATIQVTG